MPGCLYLVPTPIGNLADMTYRAVETLKEADLILAEDTRTSRVLLSHYGIEGNVGSFHQHNEHQRVQGLSDELESGLRIALISDAGTPGISDPAFLLIREAIARGIEVICLPGATAFVPALVGSGLPCERFVFEGFLPRKKGRQTRLREIEEEVRTIVIYESPLRLLKTLKDLAEAGLADRQASVAREISKKFEEFVRGSVSELITTFEDRTVRGEIVLVIAGTSARRSQRNEN